MLVTLTSTYADGRTKKIIINSDKIDDIMPDERPGSPSKSIILLKDKFRHYVTETVEELAQKLDSK